MKEDGPQGSTKATGLAYLQNIQAGLRKVTTAIVEIVDPRGLPIDSPEGLAAPVFPYGEIVRQLLAAAQDQGTAQIAPSSPGDMQLAVIPIYLGEEYLGSWLIRQAPAADGTAEFASLLEFLAAITDELTKLEKVNEELQEKNRTLLRLSEILDNSLKTFRSFIDLTDIGVYLVDFHSGELLMYNQIYRKMNGLTEEPPPGLRCFDNLGGYSDWCAYCPREKLLDETGEPGPPVVWENYLEDTGNWTRTTSRAIHWINDRLAMMMTVVDITDQKHQEEKIAYLAYYDQKLAIPNSTRLFLDINTQKDYDPYLICLDVRGLRKINDAYSRDSGDKLLQEIKEWILDVFHRKVTLYRTDGGTFALLVAGIPEEKALDMAATVWQRFESPWLLNLGEVHQKIFVQISLGVIPCHEGFPSYAELLNLVERVLEEARKRDHLLKYDDQINAAFRAHLRLELSLKACVLNHMQGFFLEYQPIAEPASGAWKGLEALCRWSSPDLGLIPPSIFIPETERLGLIGLLGEWVLNEAVSQIKEWGLDRLSHFILDVNLSPLQLNDQDLTEKVSAILQEHRFPGYHLSLEITESAEIHFDQKITHTLEQLHSLGLSLSLDDFGTGYASFANLNKLPINTIKTDRSFLENIENDPHMQQTIKIIVEFIHASDKIVIAEGVETKAQKNLLLQNNVDYAQGNYFSLPLSALEIADSLHRFIS